MSLFQWVVFGMVVTASALWVRLAVVETESVASDREGKGAICEILWQKWTPGAVERERTNGRAVWLHFAADWDIGTAINEKRIFSDPKVMQRLVDAKVVLLEADLTDHDPEVSEELRKYGRLTTPTDLVFSKNPSLPPVILSEFFTVKEALKAIDEVTR